MCQSTFRIQSLCDLVILFEECPPVPHIPFFLYMFWEYNRRDPRKCNGEENGELMEEKDVLVLYVFGE